MKVSVIVPTLNEAATIASCLRRARAAGADEIIVVDGGSSDPTLTGAAAWADRVLSAACGRARQMNAGAAEAGGDVLLFLHADTELPIGAIDDVRAALADSTIVGGRFDLRLEPSTPLLAIVARLINVRSRATRVATGDQALFVRRTIFERLAGFAEIPLMEDIDFCRRLKRQGSVACLRSQVVTSSRRWLEGGIVRTIVLMWTLKLLYYAGVSPERLSRAYRHIR